MVKTKILIVMLAGVFILAGILFAGSRVLQADEEAPVLLAAAKAKEVEEQEIESEDDFWSIFQRLFSAEEPEYEDEVRQTEVAGVRGIEREGKMEKTYDWESVRWMEEYEVEPERVKAFLEKGELGPYQQKGAQNKGEKS